MLLCWMEKIYNNNYDIYQTNDLINYKLKAMTTSRKGHTFVHTHLQQKVIEMER